MEWRAIVLTETLVDLYGVVASNGHSHGKTYGYSDGADTCADTHGYADCDIDAC